jgi:hypothetical protein
MALSALFQPTTPTKLAPIAGGLPDIPDGGSGDSAGRAGNTNPGVPSLAPGQTVDTSFANMAQNIATANPQGIAAPNPGLVSGNISGKGAVNTGLGLLGGLAMSAVPGLSIASLLSSGLGKLAQLAINRGFMGQTGTLAEAQQDAANVAAGLAPGQGAMFSDGNGGYVGLNGVPAAPAVAAPAAVDPTGNEANAPGNDPGTPGATSGGGTGNSDAGDSWGRGGTIKRTGPANVHRGEEVVRKSEAARPGVRSLLKAINKPGVGPVEGGLQRLMRSA